MTRIWTGTASVVSGYTTVVLTGDPLTAANCPADATIVLAGATYFVAEADYPTMVVELTRAYEGTDGTVSAEIDPMTPVTGSVVALAQDLTDYNARLALLDAYGKGLFYTILGQTGANDPGPGKVARNAAAWADVTALYLDVLDAGGFDATPLIDEWDDGTIIIVRSIATRGYASFRLLSAPQSQETNAWRLLASLDYLGGDGALADGEDVAIEWNRVSESGLDVDATVAALADLATYGGQANGFRVLVNDIGDGRAAVYALDTSGSPEEWIGPAYVTGPIGATGPTGATGSQGPSGPSGIDGTGLFTRVRVVDTTGADPATAYENGDTIDGVVLVTNDLVLRATSGGNANDGIYVVPASGAASRDGGFDTYDEHPGVYVSVMEGTAKADTLWRCTSNKGGTIGVTALVFSEFTSGIGGSLGSTDNRLLRSDGTGGATAQNSAITVDDAGAMTGVTGLSIDGTAAFFTALTATLDESGASGGPNIIVKRTSASPAASDALGQFGFQGSDSAGNVDNVAFLQARWVDPTSTTETGSFAFNTIFSGTFTTRMTVSGGMFMTGATGGDKGAGTINATAVYDDNTLLTCMALTKDFLSKGFVDTDFWDGLVPPIHIPEHRYRRQVVEFVPAVVERFEEGVDGLSVVREVRMVERVVRGLVPVFDADGNGIDAVERDLTEEVVVPERSEMRRHELAHLFKTMIADGFDPRDPAAYIARLRADEALPGMPTKGEWTHGGLSTGELFGRLWLATEMLAIVIINLHERLAAIESRSSDGIPR